MRHKIVGLLLSVILFVIIAVQLVDFTPFTAGAPLGPLIDSGSWDAIRASLAEYLWSYRVFDVLIQAVLLLAAVMAASVMAREEARREN